MLEAISTVPTPFPEEFRRDVIAVARQGDQWIAQLARDFGVSESCLARWMKNADREDGITGPISSAGAGEDLEAEDRALRERAKRLDQGERNRAPDDGVLRPRRPPDMTYPLLHDLAADKIPR